MHPAQQCISAQKYIHDSKFSVIVQYQRMLACYLKHSALNCQRHQIALQPLQLKPEVTCSGVDDHTL